MIRHWKVYSKIYLIVLIRDTLLIDEQLPDCHTSSLLLTWRNRYWIAKEYESTTDIIRGVSYFAIYFGSLDWHIVFRIGASLLKQSFTPQLVGEVDIVESIFLLSHPCFGIQNKIKTVVYFIFLAKLIKSIQLTTIFRLINAVIA